MNTPRNGSTRAHTILATLGVAAVTAAFAVPLFVAGLAGAANDGRQEGSGAERPTLKAKGCTLLLEPGKARYEPGERPVLRIHAENPTGDTVALEVIAQILAVSPPSPMARRLPIPEKIWSRASDLSLKPGEKKTLELEADVRLPAKQVVTVQISAGTDAVLVADLAMSGSEASDAALGS